MILHTKDALGTNIYYSDLRVSTYTSPNAECVSVLLFGPQGSGKSCIETALLKLAEEHGLSVQVLSYQTVGH